MSIWNYDCIAKDHLSHLIRSKVCPFCKTLLTSLYSEQEEKRGSGGFLEEIKYSVVSVCSICGWWNAVDKFEFYPHEAPLLTGGYRDKHGCAAGTLRNLDLLDISLPLEEVRAYLVVKYAARYDMHPRLYEEAVASVFRSLGYTDKVTSYSADGGIDIVLNDGSREIGVQVKRYRNSIKVEQIRSFVGALVLSGYTKGIFVTTSSFQKGAKDVAQRAHDIVGVQVELVDATGFLQALKIAQRPMYKSFYEFSKAHSLSGNMQFISSFADKWPGIVGGQTCLLIFAIFIFSITFSTSASKSSFSFKYLATTAGSF